MNRIKKLSVPCLALVLAFVSLFFAGCNNTKTDEALTIDSLVNSVNEKNSSNIKNPATYDEADYLIDTKSETLTQSELDALTKPNYNSVTKTQAKQDVDTLFKLLRSSYAGYTYFGGDGQFIKAKENINKKIDEYEKNKINCQNFAKLITDELPFIIDSHFSVEGNRTCDEAHTYYQTLKTEFHKDDSGYYTSSDGKSYYLPGEYEKYIRVTIGESGELVYGLFAVETDDGAKQLPSQITLSNNSETTKLKTDWTVSEVGGDQAQQAKFSVQDGVAITSLADMSLDEYNFNEINSFINNSQKCAEHDYTILDLRENDGGLAEFDALWVYGYTGCLGDISWDLFKFNNSQLTESIIDENSPTAYNSALKQFDITKNNSKLYIDLTARRDKYQGNFTDSVVRSRGLYNIGYAELTENDRTLFALQSEHNYSSGELFILMLRNVENTVTVGTNTNGCIHTGSVMNVKLPNSGATVGYSAAIFSGPDRNFDAYGIEPDIYIGGEDAQEAVLRCIKYYN